MSPRWRTVSIASRVVPGISDTITRSRPTSLLRSDDLPTFGRPRIATRIASVPIATSLVPGRRETISSSRSPVPWPCSPDSGHGSPSPSAWKTAESGSRRGSSILLASTITGRLAARRMTASSSSPGVIPTRASTTNSTRSASSIAAFACSAILVPNGPPSTSSTPPVSMRRNQVPVHSQRSSLRSRVTPGVSWTTAARLCVSRLIRVDLPTFGKPTIATVPAISRGASTSSSSMSSSPVIAGESRPGDPARASRRGSRRAP